MSWTHDPGDGSINPRKERVYPPRLPGAVPNVTTLDQVEVSQRLAMLMASRGAVVNAQGPTGVTGYFSVYQSPSLVLGLILLVFCFLPGVLYLLLGGSTVNEPFSVTFTPVEGGTAVAFSGQGKGLTVAIWAITQLPPLVR